LLQGGTAEALGLLDSGKLRFMRLFMPDFPSTTKVCGSFSLVWSFLRTGMILGTLRAPRRLNPSLGSPAPSKETK